MSPGQVLQRSGKGRIAEPIPARVDFTVKFQILEKAGITGSLIDIVAPL